MEEGFGPPVEFFYDKPKPKFPWLNVVLFLATCLTTLFVGAIETVGFYYGSSDVAFPGILWEQPAMLLWSIAFSAAIMGILFAHEMGHYLTCKYYRISATLPYFIPMPIPPIGTMGAVIRIRSPFQTRGALLDVGIAGPIAGFVLAVPTLAVGLYLSRFGVPDPSQTSYVFGEPLIYKLMAALMGKTPPPGMELYIHPIGIAAWFGFLATALNLLPVGQLDGGHVCYALSEKLHRLTSRAFVAALLVMGVYFRAINWFVWAAVLLFVVGLRHPATLYDDVPLERRHLWLAWIGLIMLVLCFMPQPLTFSGGD